MATKHRERDIEHFEQWSSSYENSWMQRAFFDQTHQAALALAASIVHQPGSVLDVGCGTGRLLRRAYQVLAGGATYWRRPGRWHDREGKTLDAQCHILYEHGRILAATG